MWAQDSKVRLKMRFPEMSERHLTATQRQRTQRHEGPPQMRLALLGPGARSKEGAESQASRMGWALALLLRDLGGAPWECG